MQVLRQMAQVSVFLVQVSREMVQVSLFLVQVLRQMAQVRFRVGDLRQWSA